jgi:hypothetical protein
MHDEGRFLGGAELVEGGHGCLPALGFQIEQVRFSISFRRIALARRSVIDMQVGEQCRLLNSCDLLGLFAVGGDHIAPEEALALQLDVFQFRHGKRFCQIVPALVGLYAAWLDSAASAIARSAGK